MPADDGSRFKVVRPQQAFAKTMRESIASLQNTSEKGFGEEAVIGTDVLAWLPANSRKRSGPEGQLRT
jgi:hypothetical protein